MLGQRTVVARPYGWIDADASYVYGCKLETVNKRGIIAHHNKFPVCEIEPSNSCVEFNQCALEAGQVQWDGSDGLGTETVTDDIADRCPTNGSMDPSPVSLRAPYSMAVTRTRTGVIAVPSL
jgi:hypothetical protein